MIVVDRLEGSRAVLEMDGEFIDVPRTTLPADTKEGDVLLLTRGPPPTPRPPPAEDVTSDEGIIDL